LVRATKNDSLTNYRGQTSKATFNCSLEKFNQVRFSKLQKLKGKQVEFNIAPSYIKT